MIAPRRREWPAEEPRFRDRERGRLRRITPRGFREVGAAAWAVALAVVLSGSCHRRAPAGSPPVLKPATAQDVLREVARSRGDVVLVDLWATWCTPCREEFPDLLRLRRELGGRGFKLVLVSADFASQRPQAAAFLADQGVTFPTFAKAQSDQDFIDGLDARWTGALPACLLFDREGRKVAFWEGKLSYKELAGKVKPLLGGV